MLIETKRIDILHIFAKLIFEKYSEIFFEHFHVFCLCICYIQNYFQENVFAHIGRKLPMYYIEYWTNFF